MGRERNPGECDRKKPDAANVRPSTHLPVNHDDGDGELALNIAAGDLEELGLVAIAAGDKDKDRAKQAGR
jgi:hypothetical protein